jgi:hypothetical protein
MRIHVKRLLRDHDYPPDAEKQAVLLVIEQAKVLGINFVEGASEASGDPGGWATPGETSGARS